MSATDDIVSGIMERWAENFSKFDADVQASLYSKNALFFGSKPTLYRGRDGVASYFNGLPKWRSRQVQFTDVVQFERQGYFVRDKDSMPDNLVFNRTIGLRDTFAKEVGAKG